LTAACGNGGTASSDPAGGGRGRGRYVEATRVDQLKVRIEPKVRVDRTLFLVGTPPAGGTGATMIRCCGGA
jgi:hypothetical protein